MADGAHDERTLNAYSKAQERFELHGGYRWRDAALVTLRGLGFHEDSLDRRLATFSGGELTRASLARALTGQPDLLLLDEPTNHLDIASLEWLEEHLAGLDAAIVLVAHDRWFLEAVGTSVLELEAGRSRFFKGPWHAWRKEQAARELALGRAIERQQAEIERLERFVTRFRAKAIEGRAGPVAGEAPGQDGADRAGPARHARPVVSVRVRSPSARAGWWWSWRTGRWRCRGARCSQRRRCGWSAASTWRWWAATAAARPRWWRRCSASGRWPRASCARGHNVTVGYVSQHAEELSGGTGSVLDATQRATGLTPGKARALLGRFLFSGEDAEKPLDGLSGGELRRLSLAVLVQSDANMLVLDEPTNHLDLESREALEDALRSFPGIAAAGVARPGAAGRGGHADGGGGGRDAAVVRGGLGGVCGGAGGAGCCGSSRALLRSKNGSR